ncbi:alanine--tRNA ligase [Candidatus Babeliales bacterium]|nr:alanine--tRNA ligase [Candidatus Babeliales bacterium]
MKSLEIRKKFFDFFTQHGHTLVPSSSLIPADDPTLLFANAGMNQFKDVFLGKEKRSYTRAVSIQKCVRAGGKHNDLDNVGFTRRHLTFFEMMGNFSFGDYFKKEAIQFAWNFLTKEMGLPADKLYPTVFEQDDEAYNLWHTIIGVPKERIYRLGASDNFWQMGDTGPCGPCSEILMDLGPEFGCGKKTCAPGCSCDRYFEIWNLVFMQFNRQPDGTDLPLSQTGVDTGMGLERLTLAVQKVGSVFETDLFTPIIKKIEQLTGIIYKDQDVKVKGAFNVLADHIRSSSMIIADGAYPSNEGRGYVVRKIIRRAALFSQKLSDKPLLSDLVPIVVKELGSIYPELRDAQDRIIALIDQEIEQFSSNLVRGQTVLNRYMSENTKKQITGAEAFTLYDTYGFPLELTRVIAEEAGFIVDIAGFEQEMEQQRIRSGKKSNYVQEELHLDDTTTEFTGYQELYTSSPIQALIVDNVRVQSAEKGRVVWIIPKHSPFYVECGGQIGDHGTVTIKNHTAQVTQLRTFNNAIGIEITAPTTLSCGDIIIQEVAKKHRANIMKNHTATHLLQAALVEILGTGIKQSGSLVHPEYLRFDFTYHKQLSPEEISKIERRVNEMIMENIIVTTHETTYQQALDKGVTAFFGDKYNPDSVRVVEVPGFSAELCGGTHVRATGDIGLFKITDISALSAGNRRIIAVTGPHAVQLFQESYITIKELCTLFKVKPHELMTAVIKQQDQCKQAQQQARALKKQLISLNLPQWLASAETINGLSIVLLELQGYGLDDLRMLAQELQTHKPGLYCIFNSEGNKTAFIISLHSSLAQKHSLEILKAFLQKSFKLRGGGTKTLLQGGGPLLPRGWEETLRTWLQAHI